jgi:hypothetical protein
MFWFVGIGYGQVSGTGSITPAAVIQTLRSQDEDAIHALVGQA